MLENGILWREVVTSVGKNYPDVALDHMFVDNGAMQLMLKPTQFDVMLCENMFGDILSDEAAALGGSTFMPRWTTWGSAKTCARMCAIFSGAFT